MATRSSIPCWASQPFLQTVGAGMAALACSWSTCTQGLAHSWCHAACCCCWTFLEGTARPTVSAAVLSATSLVTHSKARSEPAPKFRSLASNAGSHSPPQSRLIEPLLPVSCHLLMAAALCRQPLPPSSWAGTYPTESPRETAMAGWGNRGMLESHSNA